MNRVKRTDQMIKRQFFDSRGPDVEGKMLASKLGAKVVVQFASQEFRREQLVGIAPMIETIGIMQRGVERAAHHERAELGQRFGNSGGDRIGSLEVFRFDRCSEINWVAILRKAVRQLGDADGQFLHGCQRVIIAHRTSRKRPYIAEWHGTKALSGATVAAFHHTVNVQ